MITAERVETKTQLREFQGVPWRVYQSDPLWVPAPGPAERKVLDARRNPFFQHARMASWIVRRDREVVGRIAAIVDDNHNQAHNEQTGFFGFFEVVDDYEAAALLLSTARDWLAREKMTIIRGPVSPSLNYESGFLIEGFGLSPYVLTAYNPRYYPEFCARFGFAKAKDLHAYFLDITHPMPEVVHRVGERARRNGLVVRSLDFKRLDEEIRQCRAVFDNAWRDNWGFVPMTDQEWTMLAQEFKPVLEPRLILIAEMNGKPAGMALVIPDINPVLRGLRKWHWPLTYVRLGLGWYKTNAMRVALLGVVPGRQSLGVGAALYDELYVRCRPLGFDSVEISWVLEDNEIANSSSQTVGGKRYKTYRIFEMPTGAS